LLDNTNLTLCDCPGLVFPSFMITKAEMICNGLLRIDEMKDYYGAVGIVCRKIPKVVLETLYGIILPTPQPPDDPNRPPIPEELLTSYAYVRGFMGSHGMPDRHRAARIILKDYVNGVLLYCIPPTGVDPDEFNPMPILKKQHKEHKEREVGEKKEVDPMEIRVFNLYGKDNPNNRLKKEGGRKYLKRLRQQQKLKSQMYTTGKNPLFFQSKHSSIPGQSLPTSVVLTKDNVQMYRSKTENDDDTGDEYNGQEEENSESDNQNIEDINEDLTINTDNGTKTLETESVK